MKKIRSKSKNMIFYFKNGFFLTLIGTLFEYSNTCVAEYSNQIFPTNPSPIECQSV